jgi:hypothetical protein
MIHPFDQALARRRRDAAREDLEPVTTLARTHTSSLATLAKLAMRLAALERALDEDADVVGLIRLGVEAGVALFACAARPGEEVTFSLGGDSGTAVADVTPDQAHGGRWESTFFGALVIGDAASSSALCALPLQMPLASPTRGTRHHELWLEALHRLGSTGEIAQDLLLESLHETEPERLPRALVDEVLHLRVPPIELLHHLGRGRGPALEAALLKALDYHGRFWSHADRRDDAEGFVSWALSGIVALAGDRGLPLAARSGYVVPRSTR